MDNKLAELKHEYRILSSLEDTFPKGSKHKTFKIIEKRMIEILYEIERLGKPTPK